MNEQKKLTGKKIAILATDGFEQSELFDPKAALEAAGANVQIVSLRFGRIKAWKDGNWGNTINVDQVVSDINSDEFDALMLPGGVINPDKLRMNPLAVEFAQSFVDAGKPIAAICHGPQLLIETSLLKGKKITSWPSLKTDLKNAGAEWTDSEVIVDNGLVTSRKPGDIPAFNKKMIEEFSEGMHEIQKISA